MNAQTKIASSPTGATTLEAAAELCPVAQIGVRLAKIAAELDRLDRQNIEAFRLGERDAGRDRQMSELEMLEDHLNERIEWLTPQSAVGALLTLTSLRRAAHEASGDDYALGLDTPQRELNRCHRLVARLQEYLEHGAGVTPEALGLERYFIARAEATALRDEFHG